jgi:hypothetical protein
VVATLSYVYCLVRNGRRPVVRAVKEGMPGGSGLRTLEVADGVWAIVETVPQADYKEAALAEGLRNLDWVGERALAHERVIERFLSAAALLPMQLFTLFKSDDRVAEFIAADRRRIDGVLRRVEGKVEWGLRLTWDEKAARDKVEKKHHATRSKGRVTNPAGRGGVAYLARKRDILDVNRAQLAAARVDAARVYAVVSRDASDATRRTDMEGVASGSRLLLDAAFLVPAARATAFRAAVRRHTAALRGSGIIVSLTGPWPAYNFISTASARGGAVIQSS